MKGYKAFVIATEGLLLSGVAKESTNAYDYKGDAMKEAARIILENKAAGKKVRGFPDVFEVNYIDIKG